MAMLKPVLICQAVDENDPISATLVRWIRSLASDSSVASVRVLTLRAGRYELPDEVTVVDLGVGTAARLWNFYAAVARALHRGEADFFFVLQGGPYPALLFPVKLLSGRRVYQWKTHTHVSRSMAVYARWCDDLVFTATRSSFPLDLPNVRVVGHGIDLDLFRPPAADVTATADLVAVGRVTPVKRLDRLVTALGVVRDTAGSARSLDVYGPELEADRQHRAQLDDLVAQLGLSDTVRFLGAVPQDELPAVLGRHRAAVSFSDGGLDKAIAEAMACGLPVISTNAAFAELLPHDLRALLVLDHDDVDAQALGMRRVLELDERDRRAIGARLRAIVAEQHGLEQFWGKILAEIGASRPNRAASAARRSGPATSVKSAARDGSIVAAAFGQRLLRSDRRSRQVVMLHDVEDRDAFRTCIEWMRERYDIVPLRDLVASHADSGRDRLALTFDDGYADWHEVAAPVLEDLSCPATFFVSSGFVGLGPDAARTFREQRLRRTRDLAPLRLDQLRDLANHELFDIGSHTVSHLDFSHHPPPDVLASEVDGDRHRLEEWTGQPVRWFAYPWGGLAQLVPAGVEQVRRAGFDAAFTALPGTLDRADDPFLLPRQSIHVLDRPPLWNARLTGGYDLVFAAKRRVTRSA
jgi:glycosyltransferase involved in cell wall biosynthesis/peptidoglycan/xylan/chitin deacetylase (PgdA/CDA1 family)